MLVPGVGAFGFEPLYDVSERRKIFEARSARVAVENDNWRAPETLAGDAPIRALFDHFVHAVLSPGREPFHVGNLRQSFLAKRLRGAFLGLVHFYEPLLRGAENHRIVAAPAVRVGVFVGMI